MHVSNSQPLRNQTVCGTTLARRSLPLLVCLMLSMSIAQVLAQYNGSFVDVRPVAGLESPLSWDIPTHISDDGLTMLLSSTRERPGASAATIDHGHIHSLYVATRDSIHDPFNEPVRDDGLSRNGQMEQSQTLSSDGLTTYFAGNASGQRAFWTAERETIDGEWSEPEFVDLGNGFLPRKPSLSSDELTLYFSGGQNSGYRGELYKAERSSTSDPFGRPERLGLRGPGQHNEAPTLSSDELAIVFDSGNFGTGSGWELFIATRDSKDEPFGDPVNLDDFGLGSQINSMFPTDGSLRGAIWPLLAPDWPNDGSKLYFTDGDPDFRFTIYEATWSVESLLGDFNGDGLLSIDDLHQLTAEIQNGAADLQYDLDQSGAVDLADRQFWVTDVKSTWIGDANLDGQVTATDLNALALNWRATGVTSWSQGDFTGDGIVDASDLNAMALNWQSGIAAAATASPAAVPEPSSVAMLLFGLCALARHSGRLPS